MKARASRLSLLLLMLGLCAPTPLKAQRYRQWLEPYERALQAIENQDWATAAQELERSIQADGRASLRKPTYGNLRRRYLPYVALGQAYFHLGNYQKARESFQRAAAHGKLDDQGHQLLAEYRQKLADASSSGPTGPDPASDEPSVRSLIGRVRDYLESDRYQLALDELEKANQLNPDSGEQRAIDSLREEATKGRFSQLVMQAENLRERGGAQDLRDARRYFELADKLLPGQPEVREGLSLIDDRLEALVDEEYSRLIRTARGAVSGEAKDWDAARRSLRDALQRFPERAKQDGLESRLLLLNEEQACFDLYAASKYREAAESCRDAVDMGSELGEIADYRNLSQSQVDLEKARKQAESGNLRQAVEHYQASIQLDPSNDKARRELAELRQYKSGLDQANQLLTAWNEDPSQGNRTTLEGALEAFLDLQETDYVPVSEAPEVGNSIQYLRNEIARLDTPPAELEADDPARNDQWRTRLKAGVRKLFDGDVEGAIRNLENIKQTGGGGNPDLHAYLGVAYATKALLELGDAETDPRGDWNQAMAEFQAVLDQAPQYRLSEKWISPVIRAAFEAKRPG